MKILNKEQIQEADAYTIEKEPIASIDLMERASRAFVKEFVARFHPKRPVEILVGKGNNGGDGLAIARLLREKGYPIIAHVIHYTDKGSDDHQVNRERLAKMDESLIKDVKAFSELDPLNGNAVIIDALWGSGLSRPIQGFAREIINEVNGSNATVVAVDIPSGVYCDELNEDPVKVQAEYTYTFQLPKFSFMLPENQPYVGEFKILDIGLSQEFIDGCQTSYSFTTGEEAYPLLKQRKKFDHKGTFGHAMIIGGSYGKIGAPLMAARGCMRSGSGLLTAYIPACGYQVFQANLPEAMVLTDPQFSQLTNMPELDQFSAIGIGPGMGTSSEAEAVLNSCLSHSAKPTVLDADALNLLAQNPDLQEKMGDQAILTPHPGEFDRICGKPPNGKERLENLKGLAAKLNCVVVLKGAHTAIANPEGHLFFNSTGNPGMATGGSGDALTGILTGLLAQGYAPLEAAIFGVYLHGLAGDAAGCSTGLEGLMAGDLIEHLPEAYKQLHNQPQRY